MRILQLKRLVAARLGWAWTGTRAVAKATIAATAVIAGGLSFTGDAAAQDLIINGSFEDASPTGWVGGFAAYDHTTQVFYDGPAPDGAGSTYGWAWGGEGFGTAMQVVDISTVAAPSLDLGAWLASYTADSDYAIVSIAFNDSVDGTGATVGVTTSLDGNDSSSPFIIGSADASGFPDPGIVATQDNWTRYEAIVGIPASAQSAIVSISGAAVTSNGNDAYVDLVSLEPSNVQSFDTDPKIVVDRDTGTISIVNNTDSVQTFRGYAIESDAGALVADEWMPIAGTRDGSGTGDGTVDDEEWVRFTPSGDRTELAEGALGSAQLAIGGSITLNNTGDSPWLAYYIEADDLSFRYIADDGSVADGLIEFVGSSAPLQFLDINIDGSVDSGDWLDFAAGLGGTYTGMTPAQSYRMGDLNGDLVTDFTDFRLFQTEFDALNGPGALAAIIDGAAIPEPSTCVLLVLGGLLAIGVRSRS